MAYFFDLENFDDTCKKLGDQVLKSIFTDYKVSYNNYYQQYGSIDGYTPTQSSLVLNNDGTISFFGFNGRNKYPVEMGAYCCKVRTPFVIQTANSKLNLFSGVDTAAIYWDNDSQKCRWKQQAETCVLDSFKVVLNAVNDDGAMFNIGNGDKECSLEVDFDYLFKMDCQNLADILNPTITTNGNPNLATEILRLENTIAKAKVDCSQISSKIDIKSKEFISTSYSIVACPTTVPFAYGIKSVATKPNVNYCINEENGGLIQWQNILGPARYKRFLDGDVNSYTCADVTALLTINNQLNSNNRPLILTECTIPFGYKSNLKLEIDMLVENQIGCQANIAVLETELNTLNSQENVPTSCSTPTAALETLDVSVMLEVINSDGTLTTIYDSELFAAIGTDNLYDYLTQHPYDSGFYICGSDSLTGCTALNYGNELTGPTVPFSFDLESYATTYTNVEPCKIVKDSFLTELKKQSGLTDTATDLETFKSSLSNSIFASNWLNYKLTIDDVNILAQIANKKIKLSLKINNTCSNICIYIDNIKLNKTCIDGNGQSVFISESPGFNLEKIIDNKKSWLKNITRVNRDFDIKNNVGQNMIRKTNYDVNDERLVINTKEIDLDINIASAIENDVQCYINDNLGLLDSVPSIDCECLLESYEDVFEIISYEDALTSGLIPSPIDPEDFLTTSRAARDAWLKSWNELMLATAPYLDLKDAIYHPNPSDDTMMIYRDTRAAWIKALNEFNFASGGGFIEGLTIDEELISFIDVNEYVSKTFSLHEKLAPMIFNTKSGRILKVIAEGGYMYFVESPTKELKVYWANSDYAPRNKTWIDITSFVQEDGAIYGGLVPPYTPEKASFFCKILMPTNYTTWVQMISFHYQTNNNTAHNEWVNPVEDSFYIEWDSIKGKCMTNMFKEVVPEQFSMHYPITSLNFWTNYGGNPIGETPQCDVDVYLRNSGTTACSGFDFTWPNISVDITVLNRVHSDTNKKLANETKLLERTPEYYIYIIDPATNLTPDETSGYIPIKVTTTVRKGSQNGDIVFKEEYVLNDPTSTCTFRGTTGLGLARVKVYVGITDPNSAYWNTNASEWDYINQCSSSEFGTYISGSTSTLPLAGASDNGIDRNWEFDENYYVHFDVVNDNTNEVYHVTNNDFNLKDRTLPIVCPTSASTQTFNITTALNSINTFKTTILGQIQEDLDYALNNCTNC